MKVVIEKSETFLYNVICEESELFRYAREVIMLEATEEFIILLLDPYV